MYELRPQLEAEAKRKAKLRKIERMHDLYGRREGERCGDCVSLLVNSCSRDYFKCRRYGLTRGPATDWGKRWIACGKFEARQDG
jgi:hypothetical protein